MARRHRVHLRRARPADAAGRDRDRAGPPGPRRGLPLAVERIHCGPAHGAGGDLVSLALLEAPDVAEIRAALAEVADPEIPVISIVDLGMVDRVEVSGDGIRVALLPTFVGCPALELIRAAVEERLRRVRRPGDLAFDLPVPSASPRISPPPRAPPPASAGAPPAPH